MWAVCNSLIRCRPAFLYRLFVLCIQKDYDVAVKKREKAIHLLENEDDTMNTMNQKRYINLLSNLYNNLSNVYLALKKADKATEALHKTFEIRISYIDTGIIETHDML